MFVATNDSSKSNVNKIENKTCHKPGLLGGTILLGTLICSLPFATASYAENFIGSGTGGPAGSTGSDFNGSPSGTTYDQIYGGCLVFGSQPVVKNNTLTLLSQHTGTTIHGGFIQGNDSAEATNNTVDFTKGTCAGFLYGVKVYIEKLGSASGDANTVKLTDVSFTSTLPGLVGSCVILGPGGSASASKNSLLVNNTNDIKISTIYGGWAGIYEYRYYEGYGKVTASYNGIGEGREGTLTNVSSDYFYGGKAEACGGKVEAEASYNNFVLSGSSYDVLYGGYTLADGNMDYGDEQLSAATSSGNTLTVTAGDINYVYGGWANANGQRGDKQVKATAVADSNTLTITKTGTETTNIVYGGEAIVDFGGNSESSASASGNILNMQGGTYKTIYGGCAVFRNVDSLKKGPEVTASYNGQGFDKDKTSNLSGITAESFTGGYAKTVNGNATASENKFSFESSNITEVKGGHAVVEKGESEAGKADASNNTLTFSNGIAGNVYGGYTEGYASTVTANKNAISISASDCTGNVYGASASSNASQEISADSNSLQITDVKFGDKSEVYGSMSVAQRGGTASASHNVLTITNTDDSKIAKIYGGYAAAGQEGSTYEGAGTATASNNGGEQDGILTSVSCDLFAGGYAYAATADAKAEALSNTFTLSGKSFGDVYGGQAIAGDSGNTKHQDDQSVATASENVIDLTAEEITGDVYGGKAEATGERAKAEGDTAEALVSCTVTADTNNLSIDKTGTGKSGDVYGGSAYAKSVASGSTASATGNTLTINNGTFGKIYAGYAVLEGDGTAKASNNSGFVRATADLYTGAFASVASGTAEVSDNNNSEITGSYGTAIGGQAVVTAGTSAEDTATVSGNYFILDDAEVSGVVYGGIAEAYESGNAVTENNTTIIQGGSFKDEIYAGRSIVSGDTGSASSHGNTISITATLSGNAPTFDQDKTVIWGGFAKAGDKEQASYGNTLSMANVKGMTAANIKNFGSFEFYLPDMKADETVLTLTGNDADDKKGTTSIVDAQSGKTTVQVQNDVINATGANGGEFKSGDKIYLLTNANGLTANLDGTTTTVKGQTGISLQYDLTLEADGTSLYLTRLANADPVVLPENKPIAEGAASGLALANESANTATELLRDFSLPGGTIVPFAHVQASSMRHETGSHINVSSVSLAAGLGTGFETGAGNLSVGAFFEYGKGSYTTHNSFDSRSDVDGDGNSWYMGGGILAKMDFVKTGPGHFYLEGSAHMGSLHNEFDSNDVEYKGRVAQFDMDSPYYSLHGGIGYVWNITEEHDLDVYGKYMWTRVQGTDDTLTTSDKFEYDDMDSNRIRLGARYTYKGSERFRPYVGAAYEHEFAGSCESTAFDHSVSAPSFKGSSGMGEIGLMMQPSEAIPLSVNLGVQGYVGQKRGVSGNCSLMYEF